jgi:propanol-preferring alcohol dehydrogenase
MKAMVLNEYKKELILQEIKSPKPSSNEVLVKVENCGICGTDTKIVTGKLNAIVKLPHILGHEIAGSIAEVGNEVVNIREGDKGIVYFYIGCGDCEMCRTSRENICYSIKRVGFELDGGYAQYIKIPAYNFCKYNANIPSEKMAILPDAIATSYHALKTLANVKVGQTLLIVGIGGLGIHAVQIAKTMGAVVFGVDKKRTSLDMALSYGADYVINPIDANPYDQIMDLTHGKGVDIVIEIVGINDTLKWSLPSLKRGGCLVLIGYDPINQISINGMNMHYNEWSIRGSRVSTKQELMEVISLVEQGVVKPIVVKTIPLEEVNAGLEEIKKEENVGRIVLSIG